MKSRKKLLLRTALTAALVSGCDASFAMRVRQPLRPPPPEGCLDSALAASPHIVRASRVAGKGVRRVYEVRLSDPAGGYPPDRWVEIAPAPDSGVLVSVTYRWMGSSRLSPGVERIVARSAATLLEGLRLACAPDSPPVKECTYVSLRTASCTEAFPAGG